MVRVKQRYFLCELILEDYLKQKTDKLKIEPKRIAFAIHDAVQQMYGDYGLALVQHGLSVVTFNPYTRVFLLRTRFRNYTLVAASLPTVIAVGLPKVMCSVHLLHLSGTIRSSLKFLKQYDQRQLLLLEQQCTSARIRNEIRKVMQGIQHGLSKQS